MSINPSQICGLILAGGRGRRVEQMDKGLLQLDHIPMVERQLNWFKGQVDQVIISANRNLEKYQSYSVTVVSDAAANYPGPLEGVLMGLEQSPCDWLFVQPVDMPNLPNDLIERLCKLIEKKYPRNKDTKVFYLASEQRSHYLSMLISKKALADLTNYLSQGERKVSAFLDLVKAVKVDLSLNEQCFANLNQLADYQSTD